jgi:hypothetical protein
MNDYNSDASILSAQYNNKLTTPGQLSEIRGRGQFTTTGMSSNWVPADFSNQQSKYVRDLPNSVKPHDYFEYDTSSLSPVGSRKNDNFEYTSDQSSFPPGSKLSLEGDPYLQFGLGVIKETPTSLNTLFFSSPNVHYIQKRILEDIKQITGVTIKAQSENSIMIVMINKYQYGQSGWLPAQSVVHAALPRGEKACSLTGRLNRLNQATLQELIKQILSGMSAYAQYYKDSSSMPIPLTHPTMVTMKGSRVIPSANIGMFDNASQTAREIASFNMRDNIIN